MFWPGVLRKPFGPGAREEPEGFGCCAEPGAQDPRARAISGYIALRFQFIGLSWRIFRLSAALLGLG
jgi:hypothetical protein